MDVQISEPSMFYLAAYYNMSVFYYKTPRIPEGRDYMLEINPHYKIREPTDKLNKIDARWIDTETGLFIDITSVHYNLTHPKGEGMLSCKDGHEYRVRTCHPSHGLHPLTAAYTRTLLCSLSETPYLRDHRPRSHTASKTSWRLSMGRGAW